MGDGVIVGGGMPWSYRAFCRGTIALVQKRIITDYEISARELNKPVADVLITSDGRKTDGRSEFEVELELQS